MEVLSKTEVQTRFHQVIKKIKEDALFIHPTDTIYGLGCIATNEILVNRLRGLKNRPTAPLSVWAPSLKWIKENCLVKEKFLKKLPGPYTLIISLKNKEAVAKNVTFDNTIGVRYPNHWFSEIVKEVGEPIITTSANKSGEAFMTKLEDLDSNISERVDFIIYEGEKKGRPSKVISMVGEVKER